MNDDITVAKNIINEQIETFENQIETLENQIKAIRLSINTLRVIEARLPLTPDEDL